jgi:hypothetical protein
VDVVRAKKMRKAGLGLRLVAKKLGCSVNTLQRAERKKGVTVSNWRDTAHGEVQARVGGQIVSVIAIFQQ